MQATHQNGTYNALTAAYKLMQRKISAMLLDEKLTQPQFQLLRVVTRKGRASMREISDEMLVTPPNITGIIDRLESRGLIRRIAHERDRRATIIELTPKGKALQGDVAEKYRLFMQNSLRGLTADEQKALRDLLAKVQEGMSKLVG